EVLEGAQVAEVEDRPQVDEEPLVPLPGEDPLAGLQAVNRRPRELRIVRRGPRPDVAGRRRQVAAQDPRPTVLVVYPDDLVELPAIPARAVEARDLAGVVEERLRVPKPRLEPEPVLDLRLAIAVVVDVDGVANVVAELEEIRPTGRILERHIVGDDRDRVRLVRADERVTVRVVGDRIAADLWRFPLRGHRVLAPLLPCRPTRPRAPHDPL